MATKTNVINSATLSFFYVSDLIDVIMSSIEESLILQQGMVDDVTSTTDDIKQTEKKRLSRSSQQYKKLRVVLGPLEITNPKDPGESQYVSLGDVPISTKYFIQWLTKKMLQEEEVEFTLASFLNSFFNELLRDFLGSRDCFNGMLRQSPRVSQAAITSYADNSLGPDEITQRIGSGTRYSTDAMKGGPLPVLNVAGNAPNRAPTPLPCPAGGGLDREINYLTYYAGRIMPAERAKGDRTQDAEQGVHHYGIGRDRGIIKTINFTKTDAVGLKELRFEQQGYDGLQQLREQYDVDIKTFSNVGAFPGTYIYVEPESIAPKSSINLDLTQLGVGGYHMIIRSEHSFGPGQADTTITAKWVAEKYNKNDPANKRPGGRPPKKCVAE